MTGKGGDVMHIKTSTRQIRQAQVPHRVRRQTQDLTAQGMRSTTLVQV